MRAFISAAASSLLAALFRRPALLLLAVILPAPAIAQQPAGQPRQSYEVNAGDVLEVFVWGEERMQREVRVLPDGTFAFPLAGTIQAEGKSPQQIGAEVQQLLAPHYRTVTPDVTVSVRDTSGMRIYVIGRVRSPGSYSVGRSINALQALSLAGGAAEFADMDNAVILRESPGGPLVERVRLSDVLKGARRLDPGELAQALPPLRSGDVLVIP